MAKLGRRPKYVRDEKGVEIHGLSRVAFKKDAAGNVLVWRYFTTDQDGKKVWFGTDERLAISRFRQRNDLLPPGIIRKDFFGLLKNAATGEMFGESRTFYLPEDESRTATAGALNIAARRREIAPLVKDWLIEDLHGAAREIGIPELAYIHNLKPPAPSPTLESLLNLYLEKKRFRTDHERSVSKLFWTQFTRIVGVSTIRELTKEIIADYADKILAEYDRQDEQRRSQTWVKHRFGKVKAILRFARKRTDASDDITRVLGYCELFELPPAPDPDPQPIAPAHFRKLWRAADDLDKAILLFALNCCMYAEEVRYAKKEWINGNALVGYRYKKGKIPRIAVLWSRTLKALAKLSATEDGETVFGITTRQIQRRFKRLREKVGLNDVEFRHIRDGAYTVMYDVSSDKAKMVAGHKIGIEDRYVLRHPEKAAEVCAAVERHYFGPEKKQA